MRVPLCALYIETGVCARRALYLSQHKWGKEVSDTPAKSPTNKNGEVPFNQQEFWLYQHVTPPLDGRPPSEGETCVNGHLSTHSLNHSRHHGDEQRAHGEDGLQHSSTILKNRKTLQMRVNLPQTGAPDHICFLENEGA